jgi:hypothetical protein
MWKPAMLRSLKFKLRLEMSKWRREMRGEKGEVRREKKHEI